MEAAKTSKACLLSKEFEARSKEGQLAFWENELSVKRGQHILFFT